MTVGVPHVWVTPLGGTAVDVTCHVDQVSIHHGRDDTDSQPEASTCTLDLSVDTDDTGNPWPAQLEIGATLLVTVTLPGQPPVTRFTGTITDLTQAWEDEGEDTPNAAVGQVIAAGPLANLGRRVVGAVPFPAELDGARVSRIMAAAGVTLNPATSDPGTVQILARDIDSQPALDTAQAVAQDAGGIVWSTRAGEIRYADANHRRGITASVSLDACDVLVTPTWQRSTSGLVNDVSIGYGAPPAGGGDQPRVLSSSAASIATYGTWSLSAATQLAALADAQAMAGLLLARNATPVWLMTALPVDLEDLDAARTLAVLSLDVGDLVNLTGLPAAGNVPTSALLWTEGWAETLSGFHHAVELRVSGYCRTVPAPRWNDLDPAITWDAITPPSITWDGATCLGPLPTFGRWDDVPASARWDTTPASITWDTANNVWS